ncbi:MAG: hypothetical protein H7281_08780 [Bacteriovorax sp.]|nr:hypothetical protein [Bacteriovorax sp.]
MKTMLLLQRLNNLVLFLVILGSVSVNAAETKWEVAIVFRGEGEDQQFQKDVDDNILELARLNPSATLKIGLYREIEGKSYSYFPNGPSKKDISLGDLLYRQDLNQLKVPGTFKTNAGVELKSFLKFFYKESNSKRALIIYSHGRGADGLKGLSTKDLKEDLQSAPHLDLLWFDACFMSNLEFLYELRSLSDYTIASEEAEFASGLPFQTLSLLPALSSGKEASLALAKNFIESYSYLKNGKQRNYVSVSSATISIIENKKLKSLAASMKTVSNLFKKLSADQKIKLNKLLINKASMDDKSMIDLGLFLIEMRRLNNSVEIDNKLTSLIRLLNIEAVKELKTNPRIHLHSPDNSMKTQMVFGFNNWMTGSKKDFSEGEIYSTILKNDGFIAGPKNEQWPMKNLSENSELVITPFAPGINVFNYYFMNNQNGKLLTEAQSVSRTHDIVESVADTIATPLVYTAYTQQIGSKAERYTGLNITIPGAVPSIDYFELEFNQLAEWLSL